MSTPEGKVKARVKRIIKQYGRRVHSRWPVLNGMGEPTLDCVACVNGEAFYVETKAEGECLTMRQGITRREILDAGGVVFVIVGIDELVLAELDAWIAERVRRAERRSHERT